MSELGTVHAIDDMILTAAQWNAGLRRASRELQNLFMHWLFGDSAPAAGGGGVIGGLSCANVSGQMQTTIQPGMAFYYDASLSDPLSKFGLVMLHEAETHNHDAADATYDRIDIVCIASPTGTDNEESTLTYGGAPTNRDTQRGAEPSVVVVAGTPAGSPSAPATPAGFLKVCEVTVPAAATNLDAATYTDTRVYSRGPRNRGATDEIIFHDPSGRVPMLTAKNTTDGSESTLKADVDDHWPVYTRPSQAGETTGNHSLLMTPNEDRTWQRIHSLHSGFSYGFVTGDSGDIAVQSFGDHGNGPYSKLARVSADACDVVVYYPLHVEERGLEITEAVVRYAIDEVFDGTVTTLSAALLHYTESSDSPTVLGSASFVNTAAGYVDLDLTPTDTVMESGGQLVLRVTANITGGGAGELFVRHLDLTFKEGRA